MRVGTKSVLFGVHAVWIHPFFVAWAWWKLFGFPWDFRLWVAFFVHDAGYLLQPQYGRIRGAAAMCFLGGRIMGWLFGADWRDFTCAIRGIGQSASAKGTQSSAWRTSSRSS